MARLETLTDWGQVTLALIRNRQFSVLAKKVMKKEERWECGAMESLLDYSLGIILFLVLSFTLH